MKQKREQSVRMQLQGKRIAVLVEDIYQDLEVWYPYFRLKEAGAQVLMVGTQKKQYKGKIEKCSPANRWSAGGYPDRGQG